MPAASFEALTADTKISFIEGMTRLKALRATASFAAAMKGRAASASLSRTVALERP